MDEIELVVFDMAGTTVNDEDAVSRCVREALGVAGLAVSAADVNRVMGLPKPVAISMLIEENGRSADLGPRLEAIHGDFVARSIAFYRTDPSVREVEGASSVFELLRRSGVRVALNTGFDRAITDVILGRLGWSGGGPIDATIASDEVERGRPHPEMIRELMRRFGVGKASRVAKVGDTPADLEEGTNAGCGLVIGVTSGSHSGEELASFPHTHLIESIRDLPPLMGLGTDGKGARNPPR
jgi:phosphonatase-like hydrolase